MLLHILFALFLSGAATCAQVKSNLETIRAIYNLTVYPNNAMVATQGGSAVPKGLFSSNATGRVTPVGTFAGFEDSIEYFFALAPIPSPLNGNIAIYKAEIVEYTSGCPQVAASTAYLSVGKVDPATGRFVGDTTTILKQIAFWRFDAYGQVLQFDAWLPNLERWVELTSGVPRTPGELDTTIKTVCGGIQMLCRGDNQQYGSVTECANTLSQKTYGSYDEAWGDTVVCRTIHLILAQLRPQVHCPHVGPRGGDKCVDVDYRTAYFDDPLLYGGAQGGPFMCAGANSTTVVERVRRH